MTRRRIKSFLNLIIILLMLFILVSFYHNFLNTDIIIQEDKLNLIKGNSSLISNGIFLYDKDKQLSIIRSLYGSDLSTPSYFHLKDYIEINTSESQQNLGICSIFSILKAIETNISLVENVNYNFSERYVDYMMSKSFFGDRNVGSIGGEIGDPASFLDVIQFIENYGLVLEEDVPYLDYNESEYGLLQNATKVKTINQYVNFSSFEDERYYWMDILKKHITKYGGIASHIHFYERLYNANTSSFYNNGDSSYYDGDDKNSNHAVVIVGWDDSYSKDNFVVKPEIDGAFIVYNSWGSDFGDQGYFYVSYEDIDILSYLIAFTSTSPYYEKYKYYDEIDIPSYEEILFDEKYPNEMYESSVWYYAYVFDHNSDYLDIGEIDFYSSYFSTLEVYVNPYDDNIDDLEKFIHIGSVSIDSGSRYEKFRFMEPIPIYGNKFSVILKYKTGSYKIFYHNIENNDNIYIYQNHKWEKATKVPYFNLYGYKVNS